MRCPRASRAAAPTAAGQAQRATLKSKPGTGDAGVQGRVAQYKRDLESMVMDKVEKMATDQGG